MPHSSKQHFVNKWVLHTLKELLIVDPHQLHGDAYKTRYLVRFSYLVAVILTIANGINALTAFPILFIALKDLPLGLGFVLSFLMNLGLFKTANAAGTLAAANTPDKRDIHRVGLLGVIMINTLLSLVGGVGPELALNQNNLSEYQAQNITEKRVLLPLEKDIHAKASSPIAARKKCDALEQALAQRKPGTPEYAATYSQAYGQWQVYQDYLKNKEGRYSDAPPDSWPWCVRADGLEKDLKKAREELEQNLKEIETEIAQSNHLTYLKKNLPDVYANTFKENGEIQSGVEAAAVAIEVFFQKIRTGQSAELGLSLFFFVVSILTSTLAVLLMLVYARHPDVQMSWSEAVEQTRLSDDTANQEALKANFEAEKQGQLPEFKAVLGQTVKNIQQGCQKLQQLMPEQEAPTTWQAVLKTVIEGCSYLLSLTRQLMQKKAWWWQEKSRLNQRIVNVSYIHDYLQSSGMGTTQMHPFSRQRLMDYLEELSTEAEHLAGWIIQEAAHYQAKFQRLPFPTFYPNQENT